MIQIKKITSIHHEIVKWAIDLQDKKYREEERLFAIEGRRAIDLACTSKLLLHTLLCTESTLAIAHQYAPEETIVIVSEVIMRKISTQTTAAGLFGIFEIPQHIPIDALGNGIVLAQIHDPGNMGALIRTAVALQLPSIVIIDGTDPYSSKVVQASAGTIAFAPITFCSWEELSAAAKTNDICLSALVIADGKPITEMQQKKKRLLVIGSEAHGLPDQWIASSSEQLTIPMPGHAESLNAAIAGSIAAYLVYMHQN